MITCNKCGHLCADVAVFCPQCGEALPQQTYEQAQQTYGQPQQTYEQPQQTYGQGYTGSQPAYGQSPYGQSSYGQQPYLQQGSVPLPNATASLILGIFGLVVCGSLVLSILAIVFGNKALKVYNPAIHTGKSSATAGRILGIIGVIVGAIGLIVLIIVIATVGVAALTSGYYWY